MIETDVCILGGGPGGLAAATTLALRGRRVIIVATGSKPRVPKGLEADNECVLTSDTVNLLKNLPRSIAILGAGVIGCEYASIFAALGAEVSLCRTSFSRYR